jgi:hypothetical protein
MNFNMSMSSSSSSSSNGHVVASSSSSSSFQSSSAGGMSGGMSMAVMAPMGVAPTLPALPALPAMSLNIMGIVGEATRAIQMIAPFIPPSDGSYIGIQTDKGSYSAGETVQGYVCLQNNSPRMVDSVVVFFTATERTRWEEEIVHERSSGEGATHKTWKEYTYATHAGELEVARERIDVSRLSVMLAPGPYSYPFQYPLRSNLPGVARYAKTRECENPARRGRPLETFCEVVHTLEACMDMRGAFDKDLTSKQTLLVTPAFNWAAQQPQVGERTGAVMFFCCLNQGNITLSAAFDRAAYQAGETAQIKAGIRNESEQDCRNMTVRLVRNISLRSSQGHAMNSTDVMCTQQYPGVGKKSAAARDLPLPLFTSNGALMPGTKGQLVDIVRVGGEWGGLVPSWFSHSAPTLLAPLTTHARTHARAHTHTPPFHRATPLKCPATSSAPATLW